MDIYFPEFTTVFKDWSKQAAWLALRHFSTPQNMVEAGPQEILSTWREEMKRPSLKRAERLCLVASQSVGRKEGTVAAISSLRFIMTEYELITMRLEQLKEEMAECLSQIPNAYRLLSIKGMGVVAVAIIISEIGDISRFTDPRQLIKYAGLNLRENSSGKYKGKTTISKRGRRRLRLGLFQAMIPILATNAEFRALHKHNTTRSQNPLTKMQSLIALCGKLLRVTFALLTKDIAYDPEKLALETTTDTVHAA
jgi:hypothetical protein